MISGSEDCIPISGYRRETEAKKSEYFLKHWIFTEFNKILKDESMNFTQKLHDSSLLISATHLCYEYIQLI